MRRLLSFPCEGADLAATLDEADGATGLLIVPGGTQIRIGAHRGFARLAATVAEAGFPVLRFDRRGIGDSNGEDPGFASSGPDIAAAVAAFRTLCPTVKRIAAFGLCDGASALALHHSAAGLDALLLANPWVVETVPGLPPPAALRRRYVERIRSREAWSRLLRGSIDWRKAARGLRAVATPAHDDLAGRVGAALAASDTPVTVLLAEGDATAIAFEAEARKPPLAALHNRAVWHHLPGGSHSFAHGEEPRWLASTVIAALEGLEAQGQGQVPLP